MAFATRIATRCVSWSAEGLAQHCMPFTRGGDPASSVMFLPRLNNVAANLHRILANCHKTSIYVTISAVLLWPGATALNARLDCSTAAIIRHGHSNHYDNESAVRLSAVKHCQSTTITSQSVRLSAVKHYHPKHYDNVSLCSSVRC
jgi:hypothetical protein